jgi:hypothetical protein
MSEISYLAGLDLGQPNEYSALTILQRTITRNPTEKFFAVRHLERFPLGTSYPEICNHVADLFDEPPLSNGNLVVDQTGVGRAVVDLIRRARPQAIIRPVTIIAGHAVVPEEAGWNVPKQELVSVMQVLLQSRRLQVARALPMAPVLVRELETFRAKITVGASEAFQSWRERDHDDLVLAVAMAAWVGDRGLKQFWMR